jgi:hypothetical protein
VVEELVRRHPAIRLIKHEVNRGAHASLQEALDAAAGDYFYCGAADDMVLPGFFESAMSLLEKFPAAPVAAGVAVHWNEENDRQYQIGAGMPRTPGFFTPEQLWPLARRGVLELGGISAICRIADLKALGGFRASLKWHIDYFLVYSLVLRGGLAWTARPTAAFRIHAASYSNARFKRPREERELLGELVRVIGSEMPVDIREGFRASGILGRLAGPVVPALLSRPQYMSQLSMGFWRVWFSTMRHHLMSRLARTLFPTRLRLALGRKVRAETHFDLSPMKTQPGA